MKFKLINGALIADIEEDYTDQNIIISKPIENSVADLKVISSISKPNPKPKKHSTEKFLNDLLKKPLELDNLQSGIKKIRLKTPTERFIENGIITVKGSNEPMEVKPDLDYSFRRDGKTVRHVGFFPKPDQAIGKNASCDNFEEDFDNLDLKLVSFEEAKEIAMQFVDTGDIDANDHIKINQMAKKICDISRDLFDDYLKIR